MGVLGSIGKVRQAMAAAAGEKSKPKLQQARELFQLALRRQFFPEEYYLYRFYERDKDYRHMLQFLSVTGMRTQLRPVLNDLQWKSILDNKWLFHLHYAALGVPVTNVYGYYEPRGGFSKRGAPLRSADDLRALLHEFRPSSLVIKPVGGIQGRGMLILKEVTYSGAEIAGMTVDGRNVAFPEIAAHVDQAHGIRYQGHAGHTLEVSGYILEERLEQHPFFAKVNPYTTNTLRVVTFLGAAGEVNVDFAVARFGRKGHVADNWDQGGISVHVDPRTGVLGRGVLKPKHGGAWVEQHPDTGVAFRGEQVPLWAEVIAVCEQAARVTPQLRSVGWDVIVTPSGPRIIEGNPDWDLLMVQVHGDGYLQPDARTRMAQYGLSFPADRLPRPNLRGMLGDLVR